MIMEFTLNNVEILKAYSESPLERYVCGYIIGGWDDYDDKTNIVMDVLKYGCSSGIVGDLIYYSQTTEFYQKYKEEINALLYEVCDSIGIHPLDEFFGEMWDKEDPLALYDFNQNLLAWFGFEETLRNIATRFEDFEEKI